jgi:hypothetical protein
VNREERRKNKIRKKEPVFVLKKSELEQKLQESYQKGYENGRKVNISDAVNSVFTMLLGIPCKVLKEKYGWGLKKRLPEFAEYVLAEYDAFEGSPETLEELQEFIYEQTGLMFSG